MWPTILLLLAAGGVSACAAAREAGPVEARALLEGRSGNTATGLATLREDEAGVWLELDLYEAPPGAHGVHVHHGGSCDGFYAPGIGPHYNPLRMPHGGTSGDRRHSGDAGNITVDGTGMGRLLVHLPGVTLRPGGRSLAGRALVVSERSDDGSTQPDGDSGRPLACGVILVRRKR